MPAVSADGKTLVYVGYTTYGHDLYAMPLDPARFLPAPSPRRRAPRSARPSPSDVPLRRHPLQPAPDRRAARTTSLNIEPGQLRRRTPSRSPPAAATWSAIHGIAASITVEPGAPAPVGRARLHVRPAARSTSACTSSTTSCRGSGYQVNDQTVTLRREQRRASPPASRYTHQEAFASHSLGLSFSVANFTGQLAHRRAASIRTRRCTPEPPSGQHRRRARRLRLLQRRGQPRRGRRRCAASRVSIGARLRVAVHRLELHASAPSAAAHHRLPPHALARPPDARAARGGRGRRRRLPARRRLLRRRLRPRQQQPALDDPLAASSTARSSCAATRRASTTAPSTCSATSSTASRSSYVDHGISTLPALPPPPRRQRLRRLRRRLRLLRRPRASASSTTARSSTPPSSTPRSARELWIGLTLGYVLDTPAPRSATRTASAPRRSRAGSPTSSRRARSDRRTWPGSARSLPVRRDAPRPPRLRRSSRASPSPAASSRPPRRSGSPSRPTTSTTPRASAAWTSPRARPREVARGVRQEARRLGEVASASSTSR